MNNYVTLLFLIFTLIVKRLRGFGQGAIEIVIYSYLTIYL